MGGYYVQTGDRIADILARQGEAEAESARRIGAAQANRAAQTGQMWGSTLGSIGSTIGGAITKYQEDKEQEPLRQAKLADVQALAEERKAQAQSRTQQAADAAKAADRARRMNIGEAEAAKPGFDRQAAIDAFPEEDQPEFKKRLDALDDLKRQRVATDQKYISGLAHTALYAGRRGVTDYGGALQSAAQHAIDYGIPKPQIDAVMEQGKANPQATLESLLTSEDRDKWMAETKPVSSAEGSVQRDPFTNAVVGTNPKPAQLQHVETAAGIQPFDPTTGKLGPVIAQGKPTVATGVSAAGPAVGVTGEDAIKDLPALKQTLVRGLADGSIRAESLSTRGGVNSERSTMTAYAKLLDPTYDQALQPTRAKLRQEFASGPTSRNIKSIETVLGHIDEYDKAAEGLDNTSIETWNALKNKGAKIFGDPKIARFDDAVNALSNELGTAFKGDAASHQEVEAWRKGLSSDQSPQALKAGVKELVDLVGGRVGPIQHQWEDGMNKPGDFAHFMTPRAIRIAAKYGYNLGNAEDARGGTAGGAAKPAAPAGVKVSAPDGKTYTFPDQAAADKFKRDAGIK